MAKAKRLVKSPAVVAFTVKKVPDYKRQNEPFSFRKFIHLALVLAMVVSLFGNIQAIAAVVNSSSSMYGFVLANNSSGDYTVVNGQPTAVGELKNGNVGAYPEGACIPIQIEVKNTSNTTGDIMVSPVYNYFNTVVGIEDLKPLSTSLTGNPRTSADNLNDFLFSSASFTSVTSFKASTGGTVNVTVVGPFAGSDAGTSVVSSTDASRHYNITLSSVPQNVTVYVDFCAKLGLDASQYNGGAALSIRSAQGGNENVPIPVSQILQLPSITLSKVIASGTATADQWSFNITPAVNGQTNFTIPSGQSSVIVQNVSPDGNISITESGPSGYHFVSGSGTNCTFSGSTATAAVVAGNPASNASCTFTNAVNLATTGTLTVVKTVVNNNGGQAVASDFNIHVLSGSTDVSGSPQAGSSTGTIYTLAGGSYTVSEDANSGYLSDFSQCGSGTVSVTNGQNTTCTITNDDKPASLTVIKHVINDNGGTATADQFTMSASGTNVSLSSFPGAENPGTTITLNAGSYSVDESVTLAGYAKSLSADCSGTINNGETKTCTITNNDIQPKLKVVKQVNNDQGGTASSSDFTITVLGPDSFSQQFAGDQNGTVVNVLTVGQYNVSETGPDVNYIPTYTGACATQGVINLGLNDDVTCTITNVYNKPPTPTGVITVIKHVINDNGGQKTAGDFQIQVSAQNAATTTFAGSESGVLVTAEVGSYSVTETTDPGYAVSYSGGCSGTLTTSGATCTITNDDIAPKLTVTKVVINDSGTGSATSSDFTLSVGTTTVASGVQNVFDAGSFVVSESGGPTGYAATFSGDCDANGNITLVLADVKTCTITNNDLAPTDADMAATKSVSNAAPSAGDTVVYTMTVTNNGLADATNVVATDTLPTTLTFVSASSTQGSYQASTSLWTIGNLVKNAGATLEITATVNSGTEGQTITNTIVAGADQPDSNTQNNTASAGLTVNTPSVTPPSGCTSNCGGSTPNNTSSGGNIGFGGPAPTTGGTPQVAGTFTDVPSGPGLTMPTPQVLGASTSLPRTGVDLSFMVLLFLAGLALVDRKFRLV